MKVAVLGAGSWGTAVATLASKKNQVLLWTRRPEVALEINDRHVNRAYLPDWPLPGELRATPDLEEAVGGADVLVLGVPTHGMRAVVTETAKHIRPWVPVVSLAKGFEEGTLLRMTQVIKEVLPGHPAAALTGPNIAREIMSGAAAASVLATEDHAVASALQAVFRRGLFRVYTNDDVTGCEIAAALKNVVAIATGMAEGLSVGDNTRAAVITRGLAEITRLGVAMGGKPATFADLAGMGDLIVTCISPYSRIRHVGEQFGKGRSIDVITAEMSMVAEGVKAAGTCAALAERHGMFMPICRTVHQVIIGAMTQTEAYRGLRQGREEEPG